MADEDPSHLHSNLHRRLEEIEALRSIYSGDGEFRMAPDEEAALNISRQQVEDASPFVTVTFSFTIRLASVELGGSPVNVKFSMPVKYPETQAVRVIVDCSGSIRRQHHEMINAVARETAEKLIGKESILQILQTVEETVQGLKEYRMEEALEGSRSDSPLGASTKNLKRKLMWFHHIKSLEKRRRIIEWARELQLGGYCKPGFPGILIFEGEGGAVTTYTRRLQCLTWQALTVRGEEQEEAACGQEIDVLRRFPVGIRELNENGMSELGALCREAGLEALFLSGLKILR